MGPKFSKRERSQMRFYSMAQIEYCRNFIFKRHFPIHKIFERLCQEDAKASCCTKDEGGTFGAAL